jgi:hypothetical protein
MFAVAACHAAKYHWPSRRLISASPDYNKAPRLPIAPIGRADGGMQDCLNRLVGYGLRAEVAYGPLAVDGIEK